MLDYKIVLGYITVGLVILSSLSYCVDVLTAKTKPHAFSWLIWAILAVIGYYAQLVEGGGAGAWFNATIGFTDTVIFFLALIKGQRKFTRFDWGLLLSAASALILWWLTGKAVTAVILITLADCIAYSITFKKTYLLPYSETLFIYYTCSLSYLLSLFAIETYVVATWFYSGVLFIVNTAFIVMVLLRRKQLHATNHV